MSEGHTARRVNRVADHQPEVERTPNVVHSINFMNSLEVNNALIARYANRRRETVVQHDQGYQEVTHEGQISLLQAMLEDIRAGINDDEIADLLVSLPNLAADMDLYVNAHDIYVSKHVLFGDNRAAVMHYIDPQYDQYYCALTEYMEQRPELTPAIITAVFQYYTIIQHELDKAFIESTYHDQYSMSLKARSHGSNLFLTQGTVALDSEINGFKSSFSIRKPYSKLSFTLIEACLRTLPQIETLGATEARDLTQALLLTLLLNQLENTAPVYAYINNHPVEADYAAEHCFEEYRLNRNPVALRILRHIDATPTALTKRVARVFAEQQGTVENQERHRIHIKPISSEGIIGIFQADGQLVAVCDVDQLMNEDEPLQLHTVELGDLFSQDSSIEFSPTEQDAILTEYTQHYDKLSHHPFFEKAGVNLASLPLKEQVYLLRILSRNDEAVIEPIAQLVEFFGPDALRTYLILEMRSGDGGIFQAAVKDKKLTTTALKQLTTLVVSYTERIHATAKQLATELQQSDTGVIISPDIIARALQHAFVDDVNLFLKSLQGTHGQAPTNSARLQNFIIEKKISANTQMAAIGSVKELLGLTEQPIISVQRYQEYGAIFARMLEVPGVNAAVVDVLRQNGRLAPVPEIHWRVDRTTAEYERRLGVDLKKVYAHIQGGSRKPIVLEFGQGSGRAKQERQRAMGSVEFTVIDQGYYSVSDQIMQLFDEVDLPEEQKKILADLLYKKMVIREYDSETGAIQYDTERLAGLATDPASIFEGLQMAAQSLREDDVLPLSISKHIANADAGAAVIYPNHFSVGSMLTPEMRGALKHVGVISGTAETALAAIQFHPGNALFADFDVVQKMQSDEVSLALGVRSSVYKRGETWVKHGVEVARILAPGGLWIDDSLRDNDGHRYRLSEAQALQQEVASSGCEIFAVIGPGFEGEDATGTDPVPLALILSKPPIDNAAITGLALDGYEIVPLGEASNNHANWYEQAEKAVA